ncbi:MAG: chitobiase/beta-hexosaminidase C-terminal domain-containing protein [Clostridia bacterium]|nr:chitobiase/beta-hexosaminidase C-terminal domain-containing protein [Clostridia bacterium]
MRYLKNAAALCLTVVMTGSDCVLAEDGSHIIETLFYEDYQSRQTGEIIFDTGNYNVTVQTDPDNPENKVLTEVFRQQDTEGFVRANDIDPSKTSSGMLVLEEKIKFYTNSNGTFDQGMYLRSVAGNNGFQLWWGTNKDFYGLQLENKKWYKITCTFNIDTKTFDVFIQDESGYLLKEIDNIRLTHEVDFSKGIYISFERFRGISDSEDKILCDDLHIYKGNRDKVVEKIKAESLDGEKSKRFYSQELQQKLNNSIVLFVDNPCAYVNNEKTKIDADNSIVRPVIVNSRTMVPIRFLAESMGLDVKWGESDNSVTLSNGTKTVRMIVNSKRIDVGGTDVLIDVPPMIISDRTFVPLRAISEILDKNVQWDDRGIIVIVDSDENLTAELLDGLYDSRFFIGSTSFDVVEEQRLSADEEAIRTEAFKTRNSPEQIKELACQLSDMLNLNNPKLESFSMFMRTNQYSEALREFRKFAFSELKEMDEDYWDWNFAYNYDSEQTNNKGIAHNSDKMLFDIVLSSSGLPINIGMAGSINWDYNKPDLSGNPFDNSWRNYNYLYDYKLFDPLFYSFWGTGDIKYLDKWSEYMDDWCINENNFEKILPPYIADQNNSNSLASTFMYQMRLLAKSLPDDGSGFSAETLARMFVKIITEYPVITVTYMRSDPENWTPGFFASVVSTGLQLDRLGFKCADFYVKAGLRRDEDYAVTQMHPDGTQTETVFGYLAEYIKYNPVVSNLIRKYKPDIVPETWYTVQDEYVKQAADLVIRMLTPDGRYPSGFRDILSDRAKQMTELLKERFPDALTDGINQKILSSISNNTNGPSEFTSEYYPYSGLYFMRDRWTKGGQYGFMFSAPYAYQRTTGSNMFVLNAFNHDMLVAGEVGAYDPIKSPLLVDDRSQNATDGYTYWGHRSAMVSAADVYGDNRWGSTDKFDFSEAEYSGLFGNNISDVTHKRQIHFVKSIGLWIVTDRIISDEVHNYTLKWRLPVLPHGHSGGEYEAFDKNNFVIDQNNNSFKTSDDDSANLTVNFVSNADISYSGQDEPVDSDNAYKISDFYCLNANLSGSGEKIVSSIIYPRAKLSDDITDVTKIGECGFTARLNDGSRIHYIIPGNNNTETIDDVSFCGESLLLSKDKNGNVSGVALGCESVSVNGINQEIPCSDFEFEIKSGILTNTASINKPIEPVTISPGVDVFSDSLTVELSNKCSDAEIRYTTDGKEPAIDSALYTAPFTIDSTTIVKAKAFRKNTNDCCGSTNVSPLAMAVYTKKQLMPSMNVSDTEQGLMFDYYEGNWKKAFTDIGNVTPVLSGKTSALFDMSAKQTGNDYSFRYYGYINIPKSGVYTFIAPEEYIRPHIMEGYELNVYIDGMKWYPSTLRNSFGKWSIPLEGGMHEFTVSYVDYRCGADEKFNAGQKNNVIWDGDAPELKISGPDMEARTVPDNLLFRKK